MSSFIKDIASKVKRRIVAATSIEGRLLKLFKNKTGIEIGGPSAIFSSELPIYQVAKHLDGCNFSTSTIWEGSIEEGNNYKYYQDKTGFQYISEASNLNKIEAGKYDFLVSSHCLEHCANPLKTIEEWVRVVKRGGHILLILPDKQYTFDHKRPVTSFAHLLEDYKNNVDESDLTHLDEILHLHDLSLDLPAGDIHQFKERSLHNYENRCLHHHVFDFDLLQQALSFQGVKLKFQLFKEPYHQIVVGTKAK